MGSRTTVTTSPHSTNNIYLVLLFAATLGVLCPITNAYVPLPRSSLFIVLALALLGLKAANGGINNTAGILSLLSVTLTAIPAFFWSEKLFFKLPVYFMLGALVVASLNRATLERFSRILSKIMLFVLIGAVIGTIYAYFGGVSLLQFRNEDGRWNQLFLTTLTNSQFLNFIRPAGIFDEPGALSFIVCLTAGLRHGLGHGKRLTWTILILGFITFSVAHLIFVALYSLESLKGYRWTIRPIFIVGSVLVGILALFYFVQPLQEIFSLLFLNRISGVDLGNDRSRALQNGLRYLNENSFFFGINPECATGAANCADKGYKYYGDTPLTLLVHWGLFVSLPYYLTMIFGLVISIRYVDFVMVGILALLLQRPYTMSLGYSILILLTILTLTRRHTEKEPAFHAPAGGNPV
jgi:hypothetical protein